MATAADRQGGMELGEISVRCLLVPLSNQHLLLPSTAIAEVISYSQVKPLENSPGWLLGFITWRGKTIPLLSFEKVLGASHGMAHENTRIIVMNTVSGNEKKPFYAILADGIPHLSLVKHDMLEADESHALNQEKTIKAVVKFAGMAVVIPDIEMLERMLDRLGIDNS